MWTYDETDLFSYRLFIIFLRLWKFLPLFTSQRCSSDVKVLSWHIILAYLVVHWTNSEHFHIEKVQMMFIHLLVHYLPTSTSSQETFASKFRNYIGTVSEFLENFEGNVSWLNFVEYMVIYVTILNNYIYMWDDLTKGVLCRQSKK